MSSDLNNKVVVVTGAADGIGLAVAESFLQRGAKVVLLDVNEKDGVANTQKLNAKYDNRAVFWKCNVVTDLNATYDRIVSTYKYVDVLVNNAAVLDELNPRRMMEINVVSLIEWTRKFWELMRKDKGGKGGLIINMASTYAYRMDQWLSAYKASKFAVLAFTRSFGDKFHYDRSGIRIVAICPGFTDTKLAHAIKTSDEKEVEDIFQAFCKVQVWQPTSSVGRCAVELYDNAETGTAWLIEGDLPISEIKQ